MPAGHFEHGQRLLCRAVGIPVEPTDHVDMCTGRSGSPARTPVGAAHRRHYAINNDPVDSIEEISPITR